jgi:hypothetical protein
MQKVRDFVASPGNILGSMSTKHGEIAEQVEVAVRNSEQAIEERLQDASTFVRRLREWAALHRKII